ncbi:hypothetical protein BUE80_DR013290 [Diplocarpon rosae]|nr:hypothetical protein BUE80_DR013290 [Diplocarpon rosae]
MEMTASMSALADTSDQVIRGEVYRNPMDVANLLNHAGAAAAPTEGDAAAATSPLDLERDMAQRMHHLYLQRFPVARPMEMDGELPRLHSASPRAPIYLPPIRFEAPTQAAGWGIPRRAHVGRPSARSPTPRAGQIRKTTTATTTTPPPTITTPTTNPLKKKKKKPTGSFSNRPYTQEQVHWLRYHNEDCDLSYGEMFRLWGRQFPHPSDARGDGQNFSSRLYRDHKVPAMDAHGEPTWDARGKPRYIECKVRQRTDPAQMDIPFKLVEKHPEWALYWSWVRPADKAIARRILAGQDLDFAQTSKEGDLSPGDPEAGCPPPPAEGLVLEPARPRRRAAEETALVTVAVACLARPLSAVGVRGARRSAEDVTGSPATVC